ncbi:TetR/AcrR family transcriptional regulator [Tardiphaga sp. 709]|uniref:TetR/AcrR family transcriptional regulator n=1 Tax=Tardiphaga sp. 709 TaxID=3076039 RepID=UPI0028F0D9EE|nr:TetR/AcrR family transcriptional regulator [Tardiphaga sp. 709]WNV08343.1 TetR/AcrR family transcriptional regulator [Tardiphaga sp. 709]
MVAPASARKNRDGTLSQATRPPIVNAAASAASAPPSDERTEHLLTVAKATFTLKGFAATTMDDIAGAAGMSKKTLYKMFASKSELFRAMLLRSLPQVRFGHAEAKGTPIDQLRLSLKRIVDIALAPDEIALHRLIISERLLSPDIAGIFAEVIFELGARDVVEALKRVTLRSELRDQPIKQVSEMLLGIVFANDHFRLMADNSYRLNRRMLNTRIELAIAMFCKPA